MKWPKIFAIVACAVIFSCGISIAGYGSFYLPIFKIDFSEFGISSLVDINQLDLEDIIEKASPAPASVKIEEMARSQDKVGRCM